MKNGTREYDVVIMGGGPGGSTLGAMLRRNGDLKVAIFEKAIFPREHIGESLTHPATSALEQSGALQKVLASDCYIRKYGGIYNWDEAAPGIALFEHRNFDVDGIYRWTVHTDRAEFDHILLDHAASRGVDVFQGIEVASFESVGRGCLLTLSDGSQVSAKIFVEASGRQDSIATGKKRRWLSDYRNIAIWNHYHGGKPAQTLTGDWNIFKSNNLSPIACCAWEDGWFWYIPIRKDINGTRSTVHSIGLVTDPGILKQPGRDYTDPAIFLSRLKEAPMIKELVQDAVAVDEKMLTITNYSMINENFCNYDEKWVLLGDSAFFVDPLFSSGVGFAMTMALAVDLLIRTTLEGKVADQDLRDMWRDYDTDWHVMAETFGLSIDQWYHSIAKNNPTSVYWGSRGIGRVDLNIRQASLNALIDTAISPDLLQVMTKGSLDVKTLDRDGPFLKAQGVVAEDEPADDTVVKFAPGVGIRDSVSLDVPGFKAAIRTPDLPEAYKAACRAYWKNPVANGSTAPSPHATPLGCHRFHFVDQPNGPEVKTVNEKDGGLQLWRMLSEAPQPYGKLKESMRPPQVSLVRKLLLAKMIVTG